MTWIDKLERRFGRYAIHGLAKWIVILYAAGFLILYMAPGVYETFFRLDARLIFQGQIWRIFTFLLEPPTTSVIFLIFALYFYWMLGSMLENVWGAFRFNLFYFSGVIGTVLGAILAYLITGRVYYMDTTYINLAIFLAFAFEFPDMQFLLMFIIPIKVKWLGYLDALLLLVTFVQGGIGVKISIGIAMLNFIVFFASKISRRGYTPKQVHRKMKYKKAVRSGAAAGQKNGARHRCAVCGRTELDDDTLEFRYCSKCNGNYEYCQDHLFTHKHIQ